MAIDVIQVFGSRSCSVLMCLIVTFAYPAHSLEQHLSALAQPLEAVNFIDMLVKLQFQLT